MSEVFQILACFDNFSAIPYYLLFYLETGKKVKIQFNLKFISHFRGECLEENEYF